MRERMAVGKGKRGVLEPGGALGETTARVFAGTGIHKGDGGDLGTFLRGLAGTANN